LALQLDYRLNCKPQVKTLLTQLSRSCGILFKLKHHTNISVLRSVADSWIFIDSRTQTRAECKHPINASTHF